jgi:hypothetical protein
MDTVEFQHYLPFFAPLLVLQLGLTIAALVDWARRKRTRGPKWLWLLVILGLNTLGPAIYLLAGRLETEDDSD